MGQIYQAIDVKKTVNLFNIKHFVETGTGIGDSLEYVAKNVDYSVELHSIKCMAELYADAKTKFQTYGNVCVWPGYSEDVLPDLLKGLTTEPTLFWLDAHFPGADFGMGSYWDENQPIDIKLPLKVELETIVNNRDINGDIFVIDDLRMYKHGPYEAGDWLESPCLWGSEFIHTLLNSTHHVIETSVQQGYVIAFPNSWNINMYTNFVMGNRI